MKSFVHAKIYKFNPNNLILIKKQKNPHFYWGIKTPVKKFDIPSNMWLSVDM